MSAVWKVQQRTVALLLTTMAVNMVDEYGGAGIACFKESEFKKCDDSGFCKRLRGQTGDTYALDPSSIAVEGATARGEVTNQATTSAQFELVVTSYGDVVRVFINESPAQDRYQVPDVLLLDLEKRQVRWAAHRKTRSALTLEVGSSVVTVQYQPLQIDVSIGGKSALVLNGRQLFTFEHRRAKEENTTAGEWEETFKGHLDSKPRGPQAISFDLSFPQMQHVYGLPERATRLALKPTAGEGVESQPYRMYNLDVFEYEHESPFGLYGSIPFMQAHRSGLSLGAFWLNSAEMYVDVAKAAGSAGTDTQWIAESGVLDLFLLLGPSPDKVAKQYAGLTGGTAMPQLFSLGYHQCRWNYRDEADVRAVDAGFDAHDIPYDVIWLDIEHTDGKRYMTWDKALFPQPAKLQEDVALRGRKTVTIVDPHIKRDADYPIFKIAEDKGYYVKDKDGKDYDGWCWPGSSSYLDVLNPQVREWWATNFHLDKYIGSTKHLYVWNDMNEPSVFNGPEITMPKDNLHFGNAEHRDVHNVYGMLYHLATAMGLESRGRAIAGPDGDRSFVLSRAFFAGSQRVGPIWTGDNTAEWGHLAASIPMLLSINLAGLPFSGADVGGFFGNPDAEMMTRWYQLGTFYPFFRGHAHLETNRREPWLFGEETTARIRTAIRSRYRLLPYIYTLFRHANTDGLPVMRPLWYEFPEAEDTFAVDDEFMLGPALLAAPVLEAGATTRTVYLPPGATWYNADTGEAVAVGRQEVAVSLDSVPVYVRGGAVLAVRERARRSSAAMATDPFTLIVALDGNGAAEGDLYMDDGHSHANEKGAFIHRSLRFEAGALTSTSMAASASTSYSTDVMVERIVVLGLPGGPAGWQVSTAAGGVLEAAAGPLILKLGMPRLALVVRKPELRIDADWKLSFSKSASSE